MKYLEMIYELIRAGADWNAKDNNNKDFLDYLPNYKDEIIRKFPDKYKDYLMKQDAGKYNI